MTVTRNFHNATTSVEGPRAKLDIALRDVAQWSEQDRRFFIAIFTSNHPEPDLAKKLGVSTQVYRERHRALMRRFMRAAQSGACERPAFITAAFTTA